MSWMKWLGVGLAVLAMATGAAAAYGSWRWKVGTLAVRARLEAARADPLPSHYSKSELEGLPAPAQRYFRAVLKDGQPMVAAASVRHGGSFNMSTTGEQWKPFTAIQRVTTRRPGFDWDAHIMMLPGVAVRVRDAYMAGEGLLHGAVLGLVPVVDMSGTTELARGELIRFFAEAVWYPTALLPSQGVRWDAVDDASANATLTDGALAVTLLFRFGPDGLIDTVHAQARERVVDGRTTTAPWEGRFWNYAVRDGMRVPLDGEVAWLLPEGPKPYFHATTTALTYEFAK
jgi:hypothetical protein